MDVSYMVSSRADIIMGSFIADTIDAAVSNLKSDDKDVVSTYVPLYKINSQKNYRAAVFTSGYRTQSSNFYISISSSALDKADGRLVIQYQTNANPSLELLYLTYVVYPEQHE